MTCEDETLSDSICAAEPYMFEPENSDSSPDQTFEAESSTQEVQSPAAAVASESARVGNLDWCVCSKCKQMAREIDCLCCKEVDAIAESKFEGTYGHINF